MFRKSLSSLVTNIAYIRQSNLLEQLLETERYRSDPSTMSLNIGQYLRLSFFYSFTEITCSRYRLHRTCDYGNHTRRLHTAGQLQVVYQAWAFSPTKRNFAKFCRVKTFICVTKTLLYKNLVTPLSCFYQRFIFKFICQKGHLNSQFRK